MKDEATWSKCSERWQEVLAALCLLTFFGLGIWQIAYHFKEVMMSAAVVGTLAIFLYFLPVSLCYCWHRWRAGKRGA